jgi:GT2 family glycosyltransferase
VSRLEPPRVVIACASQGSARLFARATLLGRSLQTFPEPLRPRLCLLADNKGQRAMGLPAFYNRVLAELEADQTIVFVHDDVYLHDWNLALHLDRALEAFDVVGVVGSAQVPHGQPGWWHGLDGEGKPLRNDAVIRSGAINHFDPSLVRPDWYGPVPMACDLLDGVFLAARVDRLRERGVCFDPRFRFHCYDSDFCYTARSRGLRLGTWPLPLTHGSAGSFDDQWVSAARLLRAKLASAEP